MGLSYSLFENYVQYVSSTRKGCFLNCATVKGRSCTWIAHNLGYFVFIMSWINSEMCAFFLVAHIASLRKLIFKFRSVIQQQSFYIFE